MNIQELLAACVAELSERIDLIQTRIPEPGGIQAWESNCSEGIEIASLIAECFTSLRVVS